MSEREDDCLIESEAMKLQDQLMESIEAAMTKLATHYAKSRKARDDDGKPVISQLDMWNAGHDMVSFAIGHCSYSVGERYD